MTRTWTPPSGWDTNGANDPWRDHETLLAEGRAVGVQEYVGGSWERHITERLDAAGIRYKTGAITDHLWPVISLPDHPGEQKRRGEEARQLQRLLAAAGEGERSRSWSGWFRRGSRRSAGSARGPIQLGPATDEHRTLPPTR